MGKSRVRLSQCMIVKNEERNIRQALSWGKGLVREQIVVDTGSTDNTVQIAQELGASVYHFPWCDDFSAAKNFAIEKATGNWIAFLDADEFFPPEELKKLRKILQKAHENKKEIIRTSMVHVFDREREDIQEVSVQERIFRNRKDLRYRNRIHEELGHVDGSPVNVLEAQEDLSILHTGYSREVDLREKGERNIRLLQRELQEDPENPLTLMYLADSSLLTKESQQALQYYRKAMLAAAHNTENRYFKYAFLRSAQQIMTLRFDEPPGDTEEEFSEIYHSVEKLGWSDFPDIDFFMGCRYANAGDLAQAAPFFEQALQKAERYTDAESSKVIANQELPHRFIAMAAVQDGNLQKAVSHSVAALRADRYSPDACKVLLDCFFREWKPGQSAEPYWSFLCKLYDPANLKDLMFLHRFSQEMGFSALTELIWNAFPQEAQAILEGQTENQ